LRNGAFTRRQRSRDPEVRDHRVSSAEKNVLGFYIAMDHAVLVSVIESIGHFARYPDCVGERQLVFAIELGAKRFSLDERHGEPQPPCCFAGIENAEDVGMLQPRGKLDLTLESIRPNRLSDFSVQYLERNGAVVPKVRREEDYSISTSSDLMPDYVMAGERCA